MQVIYHAIRRIAVSAVMLVALTSLNQVGAQVLQLPTEGQPHVVVKLPTPPMIPSPEEIAKDGFVIDMSKPLAGTDLPLALGDNPGKKDNALIITGVIDHLQELAPQASIVILQFPAGKIMIDKAIYLGDHGKRVLVLRGQGMGKTVIHNPKDEFNESPVISSGCPGSPLSLYNTGNTANMTPSPTARPMVARQGAVAIAAGDDVLWVNPKDYADAVVGEGLWFFSDEYYGPDNKRYKPAYGEAIYIKDKKVVDGHCELILETPAQETYYVGRGARPPYGYDNYDGAIWVRGADIKHNEGYWNGKRTSFAGRYYVFEDLTMSCGTRLNDGHGHTGSIPIDSRFTRCEFIASQSPAPYGNTVTRVVFADCVFRGGGRGPEMSFLCRNIYFKDCTLVPMQGSPAFHRSPWLTFQECTTDCLVDGLTVKANEDGQEWVSGGNMIRFTGKRCGIINSNFTFGDFKREYVLVTVHKQISHAWPNGNQFFRNEDNYFINNKVTIGAGAAKGQASFRLVDAATNFTAAGNTIEIRSPKGTARFVSADENTQSALIADNTYLGTPTECVIDPGATGVRLVRNSEAASSLDKPNPAVEVVPGAPQPGPWAAVRVQE